MTSEQFAVLAHGTFTLAMCGLMIAVQLVIYPQFRNVSPSGFPAYVAAHSNRMVAALAVLAPFEMIFGAWIWLDPADEISRVVAFVSGGLLALGWISTAAWFAPLHGRLQAQPYDRARIEQLITTNWLRTVIWLARAALATWFMWQVAAR